MTTASVPTPPPRPMPRTVLIALAVPMALYLLLHYVAVYWLTANVIGRVSALSVHMFTVGGIDVRLGWLLTALIIVLALSAHAFCLFDDFGVMLAVALHLPAVVSSWMLVWSGFTAPDRGLGDFLGNLLLSVLFLAVIEGSAFAIGGAIFTAGEKYL